VRALSERLKAGADHDQLSDCLTHFPKDLEDYFQTLVYERISETWREGSETAQVLKIATVLATADRGTFDTFMEHGRSNIHDVWGGRSFLHYWHVANRPGLHNENFAYGIPVTVVSKEDAQRMTQKTIAFINHCARDLLTVMKPRKAGEFDNGVSNFTTHDASTGAALGVQTFYSVQIDFAHRTVYDYLMTTRMQALLNRQVPQHFQSPLFLSRLCLSYVKHVPDVRVKALDFTFVFDQIEHCWIRGNLLHDKPLLAEIDRIARTHHSQWSDGHLHERSGRNSRRLRFADFLVSNSIMDYVLTVWDKMHDLEKHSLLCSCLGVSGLTTGTHFSPGKIDARFLDVLLRGKVDPNKPTSEYEAHGRCPWHLFLRSWVRSSWVEGYTPPIDADLRDIRPRMPVDDKAWYIAERLIKAGASLEGECCIGSTMRCGDFYSNQHRCCTFPIKAILNVCVPDERHAELKALPSTVVILSNKGSRIPLFRRRDGKFSKLNYYPTNACVSNIEQPIDWTF
jgi:hypothetical protein